MIKIIEITHEEWPSKRDDSALRPRDPIPTNASGVTLRPPTGTIHVLDSSKTNAHLLSFIITHNSFDYLISTSIANNPSKTGDVMQSGLKCLHIARRSCC